MNDIAELFWKVVIVTTALSLIGGLGLAGILHLFRKWGKDDEFQP